MRGTITITQTTYLKPSTEQVGTFDRAKVKAIAKGCSVDVLHCTEVDGHYKVILSKDSKKEWFVFKSHCIFRPAETPTNTSVLKLDNSLASLIVLRMQVLGLKVFSEPGELNIVYLEGVDLDGAPNADRLDEWNDVRVIFRVVDGKPEIVDKWRATSEVGGHYTYNPMNKGGAARIKIDSQYKAWKVGMHGSRPYEALVQVAPIDVCRDLNKDGKRTGDKVHTGLFGVNQHHGYNSPNVGRNSAGCLVGQSIRGHEQFMKLIKTDVRYKADSQYIFWTAVLDGSKL